MEAQFNDAAGCGSLLIGGTLADSGALFANLNLDASTAGSSEQR